MPKAILTTKTGQNKITGLHYARCYSLRVGVIEKWGETEDSALRNLQKYIAANKTA